MDAVQAKPGQPEFAVELLDVHKQFGKTQIIRGAQLQVRDRKSVV